MSNAWIFVAVINGAIQVEGPITLEACSAKMEIRKGSICFHQHFPKLVAIPKDKK